MTRKQHIHFIGIGGIGMSGIAQILAHQGFTISGCDTDCTQKSITLLKNLGCTIADHHESEICRDKFIDKIVYSTDIQSTHPEIQRALHNGITLLHRSEMLAQIMKSHTSTIGITGSHGKTTTTSLVSHIFLTAHKNPTVVVGGILSTIDSNACLGDKNIMIIESDESDKSLLNTPVTHAILTSISAEHLNIYKDLSDVQKTFTKFLNKIPSYGKAFVCLDDPNIVNIVPELTIPFETYGTSLNADWKINLITLNPSSSTFTIAYKKDCLGEFNIPLAGIHNIKNTTTAVAVAYHFGISLDTIKSALKSFKGVDRRFTFRGTTIQKAEIFDDYGHHPVELAHTFPVARNRARKRLIVIFQPHRYTRTQALWNDFLKILSTSSIDHIILTDIHTAHEEPIEGISSQNLYEELIRLNPQLSVTYQPLDDHFKSILNHLNATLQPDDLLLIQGAGKITKIAEKLTKQI